MMISRHLVDRELLRLLAMWPDSVLDETTLPLARASSRLSFGPVADPDRVTVKEYSIPGIDGAPSVALLVCRPARSTGTSPCIYYIHGGGYVMGTAASREPLLRTMADLLDCVVVAVEYRLAPETPFPGPLDDCQAGLDWLFRYASDLAIDPSRIGVSGESAGGGLAAALALAFRDQGQHRLAFQHLVYPMLDDRTCTETDPSPYAGEYIWNAQRNRFGWSAYLGHEPGTETLPAYAAPARAQDVTGLPPSFLCTGALDLFVQEDIAFANRLIRSGVLTEFHVYPGAFHGFDVDQSAGVSQRMRRDSWDFLKRHLHPSPSIAA